MDGSTNAYLREDRAIEDFLKTIEPNYNAALDKLIAGDGEIDNTCIYTTPASLPMSFPVRRRACALALDHSSAQSKPPLP